MTHPHTALDALYVAALTRGDDGEARKIEFALERMRDAIPPAPRHANMARWYAEQGYPVFSLPEPSKRPHPGSNGFKEASTDPVVVARTFEGRRNVNVALATGHRHDVVDIDPAGHATLAQMLADDPEFPPLIGVILTPRGGFHLWVPPTGRGNTQGRWPGIDYRGLGGYALVPPSYVDEDESTGHYVWLLPPNWEG